MPMLNSYSNYKSCVSAYTDQFKYCVTHVYIEPNASSEVWKEIDEFSAYTYQHYRHDVLKRGVCMNDCVKMVQSLEESQKMELSSSNFTVIQPYPAKIGQEIPEISWTEEDLENVTICNNVELEQFYGLRSVSRISFCLTETSESKNSKSRKNGDKLDYRFMMVASILLALVMNTTLINAISHDESNDSFSTKLLSCFDAKKNFSMLMKPSPVFSFTAWKLILVAIVICAHSFTALSTFSMVDSFSLEDSVHRNSAIRIRAWQIFIPGFFAMSGYLMSFTWIGRLMMGRKVSLKRNVFAFINRFIRFFPSMAFMVFFFATRFYYSFSDPKWLEVLANERINCQKNGWMNLLFINNLVNNRDGVSRTYFLKVFM